MDGYDVLRRIRSFSGVPIIMLTAKSLEKDIVKGFDAGADDYLTKPFGSQELISRVKAVLRRSGGEPQPQGSSLLKCDDLVINFDQASVEISGRKVELTSTEFRLLSELASDQLISHQELLTRVWGRISRRRIICVLSGISVKNREKPIQAGAYYIPVGLGYMFRCSRP